MNIYLEEEREKVREGEMDRQRERDLPSSESLPKSPQHSRVIAGQLGQAKARDQKLHLGLSSG